MKLCRRRRKTAFRELFFEGEQKAPAPQQAFIWGNLDQSPYLQSHGWAEWVSLNRDAPCPVIWDLKQVHLEPTAQQDSGMKSGQDSLR